MLDEDHFTAGAQHAYQLAKKSDTGLMPTKLVGGEYEKDRIQAVIRKRQGAPISGNRQC